MAIESTMLYAFGSVESDYALSQFADLRESRAPFCRYHDRDTKRAAAGMHGLIAKRILLNVG